MKQDTQEIVNILEVFEISKMKTASYFLGMEIIRDRETRSILLTQRKYTKDILKTTKMEASILRKQAKRNSSGGKCQDQQGGRR
jgi:hypothetical protein